MKRPFDFLKTIAELAIVAIVLFIAPAIVHSVLTLDFTHYLNDLSSSVYCGVMSFVSFFGTFFFIMVETEN